MSDILCDQPAEVTYPLERAQGHTRRALNNLKPMGEKLPSVIADHR